ncbi:ABC transporter ATP-binding protein [Paenarthrobacter nitroguajacolicus]|uniref:amino acid ABC transporter ATP-binding/permease protein n=1 Tax=Paenarthrobacter nitroguajacolicus TaxID=211146 RepID=UPI0015B9B9B9|nr:ABC transporter ATP-binding protein [Paenarthrobacter nitroguajacolicus]NWL12323.1 ABC transporter ATP-binding protein [Paenarthrobacter nitroguajacolicus]
MISTTRTPRNPLLGLIPHMSGEWAAIVWTAAVGILNNLALIVLAVIGSYMVALAVMRQEVAAPVWWFVGIAAVVLRAVLTWHEMDTSHSIAYRILAALRMALFDGFARGVPSRKPGQHTGKLAATAMGDVEKLEFFYAHTVAQLAGSAILFIAGVAFLLPLGPEVAGALLLGFAALVAVTLPGLRRGARLGARVQQARSAVSVLAVDLLAGTREILGFGLQEHAQRQLAERSLVVDAGQRKLSSFLALAGSLRELCVLGTVVAVFLAAISKPGLDAVWLPALVAGTLTLLAPVAEGVATVTQLQPHRASAQRVLEGISLPSDRGVAPAVLEFDPNGPLGVEVKNLQFTYDDGQPALRPTSLSVAPGEHVGISGRSGAGKTTLARLLVRLWAPDSGSISLVSRDGREVDAWAVSEASFRRMVTLVEQDSPVFHGSVLDNMRLACPNVTASEVLEALERAGLPLTGDRWAEGVDTVIGEQGMSLSGGERARFCLARALLIKPRILVLDETSASLDPASEQALVKTLGAIAGETTIITVSHRESTLAACDRRVHLAD